MDLNLATAAIAALLGLCTGVVGILAFRWSEWEQQTLPEHPEPVVPPGVAAVLSVLRSLAVVLDADDVVVKASPAAYSFGIVRDDRLTSEGLLELVRRARRDGEIRQIDLEIPRGPLGGGTLTFVARVAPLGSALVLVLIEDQTEAKRIDAIRRDFVANVSHELKTPVGALALLSEAVLEASDDPEAVRRFAGRMQHEATRLTSLVQELIDLSRLQNDDPLAEAVSVPVAEVVAEAIDRSRQLAASKEIRLVSGGQTGLHILGDHAQLVMALGNLVENAVNYSPDKTRVAVTTRRNGELVEIAVTDQGIGIPEKEQQRIFERFYRVDPARSRATGGTGLGLSIVKHVAATHGGEVSVWSVEGAGSTFTLRLPRAPRGGGALRAPAPVVHSSLSRAQEVTP